MFLFPVMENMYFWGDLHVHSAPFQKGIEQLSYGSGVELQSVMHQPRNQLTKIYFTKGVRKIINGFINNIS